MGSLLCCTERTDYTEELYKENIRMINEINSLKIENINYSNEIDKLKTENTNLLEKLDKKRKIIGKLTADVNELGNSRESL